MDEKQLEGIKKLTNLWRKEVAWELEDLAQEYYNNKECFDDKSIDDIISTIIDDIQTDGDLLSNLAALVYERYCLLKALHD